VPESTPVPEIEPEPVITDAQDSVVAEPTDAIVSTDAATDATQPATEARLAASDVVPAVTASVLIESNKLRAGKEVKASLVLQAITPTQGLNLVVTLPKGVEYVEASSKTAIYDPATRQLLWRGLSADIKTTTEEAFRVLVSTSDGPANFVLDVAFVDAPADCCTATPGLLRVGVDKQGDKPIDKDRGGRVKLTERITLDFPAGALKQTVTITGVEYAAWVSAVEPQGKRDVTTTTLHGLPVLQLPFELGPEMDFNEPVTATIDLSGVVTSEMLNRGFVPEVYYMRPQVFSDTKKNLVVGESVPSVFSPVSLKLVVRLAHFSEYNIQLVGKPEPWKLTPNLGTVGLFRGSANFGYPIATPALMDGWSPMLSLQYSSAAADGGAVDNVVFARGWSLTVPHIRQGLRMKGIGTYNTATGATEESFQMVVDQDYKLSIGGAEYNLISKGNGEYVTESYAPIRVFKCGTGTCNGLSQIPGTVLGNGANQSNGYWQVWMPDGMHYVFGGTDDSTKWYGVKPYNQANVNTATQTWYLKWVFSPVRDDPRSSPVRRTATYTYTEYNAGNPYYYCGLDDHGIFTCADGHEHGDDERILLSEIAWGSSKSTSGTFEHYKAKFSYESSPQWEEKLSLIEVQATDGANTWTPLRKYAFTYQSFWNLYFMVNRLTEIREYGYKDGAWANLPPTILTYDDGQTFGDFTLTEVNNGYGGKTKFGYYLDVSTRWVNRMTLDNGMGWQSIKAYAHTNPCYNTANSPCRVGHDLIDSSETPDGSLIGFGQVEERQHTGVYGSSPVSLTMRHTFSTNKKTLGRETTTRWFDGETTAPVLQAQTSAYWLREGTAITAGIPISVWFTPLYTQTVYPYSDVDNAKPYQQTVYKYDGYANQSVVIENGYVCTGYPTSNNCGGDERTTLFGYAPNLSKWIVNKLAYTNVYSGAHPQADPNTGTFPPATDFKTQTLLAYDNNSSIFISPTKGLVTRVNTGHSTNLALGFITQTLAYDAHGNVKTVTDTRNITTTATYDTSGRFLIQVKTVPTTNATGGLTTKYVYYGINDSTCPVATYPEVAGGSGPLSALKCVIDPNNIATAYGYDTLGRLLQVAKPGNDLNTPTQGMAYFDGVTPGFDGARPPLKIAAYQRDDYNGTGNTQQSFTFYDGLGRPIQTRSETQELAEQTVANITYDVFGRAERSYVPALEPWSETYMLATGWDTRPSSVTQYDALSRVKQTTGPDGNSAWHTYQSDLTSALGYAASGLSVHSVKDANQHIQHELMDGLGRLLTVREFAGDGGVTAPWSLYAETKYAYDAANGLTRVTDALANTTVITYDALSRKTGMRDPDMGTWSYGYDTGGNLITQTDALTQTLWFGYDALNRMLEKRLTNSSGTLLATFEYDKAGVTGTFNKGRLTKTINQASAVTTTLNYDKRGNLKTQAAGIDGITYPMTLTYDNADRVIATAYPDGEVVNQTYDAAMRPYALSSSGQNYVSSAAYNALSQPTQVVLSNGLSNRWYYYGTDVREANGNSYGQWGRLRLACVITTSAGNCPDDFGSTGTGWDGAAPLLGLTYFHDTVGNVKVIDDRTGLSRNSGNAATWFLPQQRAQYGYDALDRLTSWTQNAVAQESYGYNLIGNLTFKTGVAGSGNLYYNDANHKHGVTHGEWGPVATYDANGNMTQRWNQIWYGQEWTVDNKLSRVWELYNPSVEMRFFYDADGNRVKTVSNGTTTIYAGSHYEKNTTTGEVTKYYYFGGQRVAMRKGLTLSWLHSDHLGSASLATNTSGNAVANSSQRFTPFGSPRLTASGLDSKFTFTGQRSFMDEVGTMDYGARQYSPLLGRFLSADSIVPRPGDPQAFNRYAYTLNNPLKYVDPSGHDIAIATGAGEDPRKNGIADDRYDDIISVYKGWSPEKTKLWRQQWSSATDEVREKMEHAAGIRFLSYSSVRGEKITEQDILNVQTQLEGFQDITLVGYSKGANLVENYIAHKHSVGFDFGPDVSKFVIMKAPFPGGYMESQAGGMTPGSPFSTAYVMNYCCITSINGFGGGSVVNIYGAGDPIGSQGFLAGAKSNYVDQTRDRTTNALPHGVASSSTLRQAFIDLNVSNDHGASSNLK
jgi:RHS repeat-associated protein